MLFNSLFEVFRRLLLVFNRFEFVLSLRLLNCFCLFVVVVVIVVVCSCTVVVFPTTLPEPCNLQYVNMFVARL